MKKALKRILMGVAGLALVAFLVICLAVMWIVGQLPH
jgi:hypothetical protein